jgi:aminopeptidase N
VTPEEYEEAARLLGRSLDEVRLRNVSIRVLLQPGHGPQAARHVAAAKAGLKWFGLWYGRYPYPTLTVVDPAHGGGGSAGMEYPTFITAGTSFLLNRWPFDRVLLPEEVTVHEFGHQYWQSMVATNEFEESWLDEGFDSYSTAKVMSRAFGPWLIQLPGGLRLGVEELARLGNHRGRAFDAIRTSSWRFSPGNYGFNSYDRTDLTLRTLEAVIGAETMARVMRTYHERFRFRHPSSDDFYATATEVAGRDLRSFFEQTVERPGIVDYEVSSVRSERVDEPRGIVGDGPGAPVVTRTGRTGPGATRGRGARPSSCAAAARSRASRRACSSRTRAGRRRRSCSRTHRAGLGRGGGRRSSAPAPGRSNRRPSTPGTRSSST